MAMQGHAQVRGKMGLVTWLDGCMHGEQGYGYEGFGMVYPSLGQRVL